MCKFLSVSLLFFAEEVSCSDDLRSAPGLFLALAIFSSG